jgi:hypothetical protein
VRNEGESRIDALASENSLANRICANHSDRSKQLLKRVFVEVASVTDCADDKILKNVDLGKIFSKTKIFSVCKLPI